MRHLFRFGFEDPQEFRANAIGDWGDESSEAIWINAPSVEDALAWGQSVADQFVTRLFERAKVKGYSWLQGGYANWIEDDEAVLEWARTSPEVIEADFGVMPDVEPLVEERLRLLQ